MAISCCHGCFAPKRHPGCHDHCPAYLKEKAAHDALREEENKKRDLKNAIMDQRGRAVHKAMRHRRKGKYGEQ